MFTINDLISEFLEGAKVDDFSFADVIYALEELDEVPPGTDDTERMLNFVARLLDSGFVPVTSPYNVPPGEPWPEQGTPAILDRIKREWLALDHAPTFIDICWFHHPA